MKKIIISITIVLTVLLTSGIVMGTFDDMDITNNENITDNQIDHVKINQIKENITYQTLDVFDPSTHVMWIETWNEYHKPSNSLNITTMNNTTSVSLEEVIIFMANDTTIKNTYENDSYNCTKYTTNIVNNAIDQGILAYPVRITFENETQSRVIVTFPTNDHGYVYFDSIPDTNTTYTQYEDRIVTDLDINKPMIEYNPITNTTTEIGIVDNVVMYRLEDADYPYSFDFSTGKYDSIRPLDKPSDNINNSTESMVNVAYNQTINTYDTKNQEINLLQKQIIWF